MEDVLRLLDGMFAAEAARWDGFYADRSRDVPFFVDKPDESLVSYVERGLVGAGRALDLGCGAGRNAIYLAGLGFEVDGVDLSRDAIAWARERAGGRVRFFRGDAFALAELTGPYDLVYDSGCFHHLAPHRRVSYLGLLERILRPGGHLGLACFAAGGMGAELDDAEFYQRGRLEGGLAYTAESLRWIFSGFTEVELRRMREDSPYFGKDFLWAGLFSR